MIKKTCTAPATHSRLLWSCLILVAAVVGNTGCDMGTYNQRLSESPQAQEQAVQGDAAETAVKEK